MTINFGYVIGRRWTFLRLIFDLSHHSFPSQNSQYPDPHILICECLFSKLIKRNHEKNTHDESGFDGSAVSCTHLPSHFIWKFQRTSLTAYNWFETEGRGKEGNRKFNRNINKESWNLRIHFTLEKCVPLFLLFRLFFRYVSHRFISFASEFSECDR